MNVETTQNLWKMTDQTIEQAKRHPLAARIYSAGWRRCELEDILRQGARVLK